MRLEAMTAEIRPRSEWEAVDLGWALTRRDYGRILKYWSWTVWPLWAGLLVLFSDRLWVAMLIIWWLKPLTERVPLYVMSRSLFGAPPGAGTFWREMPRWTTRRLFHSLVGWRFSIARSVVLPVSLLEELKGGAFRRRASSLTGRCAGVAWWMQIVTILFIHFTWLSLATLIYFMLPTGQPNDMEIFFVEVFQEDGDYPRHIIWTGILSYLAALTLLQPFYVGAGFGLYLNARTHLEGWDVELSFRRMARRLGATAALTLSLGALVIGAPDGFAAASDPQETIEDVLADPDFEIHTETRYVFFPSAGGGDLPRANAGLGLMNGMSSVFSIGLLAFAAVIIVGLIMKAVIDETRSRGKVAPPKAKTVVGLDLSESSLPKDLAKAARELWEAGRMEEAVTLLYRGALSWLVNDAGVPIRESDTEADCLRRARDGGKDGGGYLEKLTRGWMATAYGQQAPAPEEVGRWIDEWPYAGAKV